MTSDATLRVPDEPLVDLEDLQLRRWTAADAAALADAWQDEEIARWTGVPADRSEDAARRWISDEGRRLTLVQSVDLVVEVGGTVVGEVGAVTGDRDQTVAEIGWWIGPGHRRRGLATRAVRLFVPWFFGMWGVTDLLVARCHPDNPASSAVARQAGFTEREPDAAGTRVWVFSRGGAGGTVPT